MSRISRTLPLLFALLCAAGCTSRAVIIAPGPVSMPSGESQFQAPEAWSVLLKDVADMRPPDKAGERVGTLYSGFRQTTQAAFLDPRPAAYLKEQLSRYLLYRGLEASTPESARLYLTAGLEEFALVQNPGHVWDDVLVRVAYTVRFQDRSGQELGQVRLAGSKEVNVAVGLESKVKEAFRDSLLETFKSLARSDVFLKLLQSQQ